MLIDSLRCELAGMEKLIRNLAVEDPVFRLLMTMSGVGPVVALTFRSAIDGPGRFRRSKGVGPWVRLTPGRNQSSERDILGGRIAKAVDAGLRTPLYQYQQPAQRDRWRAVPLHHKLDQSDRRDHFLYSFGDAHSGGLLTQPSVRMAQPDAQSFFVAGQVDPR